jgi:hypothetical protein
MPDIPPLVSWQQAVLAHFTPKRESMLLAIDPDGLLRDDVLLAAIQNANYDVLELANEVAFRNIFERSYRSRWDNGEARHVVVVVHTTDAQRHIPYDLWCKSRRIDLSASLLFPNLNALVVRKLDSEYYDGLYAAHQQLVARGEKLLSERQTIEFILRVVFRLDPAGANDPARWVEFLIDKHYSRRSLPPELEHYAVAEIMPRMAPAGLAAAFMDDGAAFYRWLGEQWAGYVAAPSGYSPPPAIDFGDMRLRPLLAYLFSQGLVPRAPAPASLPGGQDWIAMGVTTRRGGGLKATREESAQAVYNLRAQLTRFMDPASLPLPVRPTDLRDWLGLAAEWSHIVYQANSLSKESYEEVQPMLVAARLALDAAFWEFIGQRYSAAGYYDDNKGPLTVAAVARWLSQRFTPDDRVALLCFDGLALDQWRLLRDYLDERLPGLSYDESATYAIAPTLTPYSRQALFSGRMPSEFPETLNRTDKDAERWTAFWVNHGIPKPEIAHVAIKPKDPDLGGLVGTLARANRRLGILIGLFDDVMHGTEGMPATADKRVYYATLRSQLNEGHLDKMVDRLLSAGYRVFVAADHGNVSGVGTGQSPAKALVDKTARRVAIFDQAELADEYAQANSLRAFRTKILPADVYPVYQPGTGTYAPPGTTQVSHGGLSVEELVVPFVQIKRAA